MYNPYPGYANSYPPPQYPPQPDYNQGYGYQGGYGYPQNPPPPQQGYSNNSWQQVAPQPPMYNGPPPPQPPPPEEPKSEAVLNEMEQQKNQLLKQREDYVRKCSVLRRELEQLKQQKHELSGDGRSERELKVILKENERLQEEIQGKMKAILNVIEMLSSIIKDGKKIDDLEAELVEPPKAPSPVEQKRVEAINPSRDWESSESRRKSETPVRSATPPIKRRSTREYSRERESDKDSREKRFNYTYYDTGMHWCRSCDVLPETAKEYLLHLQSKEHQETAKENEVDTTPWHKLPLEPVLPSYDDAPKKRLPIKGLQFFVSAPSWYCKLCDTWIGDLHCASHHLKSLSHAQNYENFVEQNPHWETEWLKDREKSMGRKSKNDDESDSDKKRKHKSGGSDNFLKEKKKKKRSKKRKKHSTSDSSSSSSSDSSSSNGEDDENDDDKNDKSKSIRVAMRNIAQVKSIMNEDMSKWSVLEKLLAEHQKSKEKERSKETDEGDHLINQWMTIVEPPEKDKFESLKDRMKVKQDAEKAKIVEYERRRREKERQEREVVDRRRQREREEQERQDYERRRKAEEEYHKIVDKDRNQVRFRASRDHYRRRRPDESDDDDHSRSRNKERHTRESPPSSRYRKDSSDNRENHSRGREEEKPQPQSPEPKVEPKKKPPGPPSYKKLPFIGRMPLYKSRKADKNKAEESKEVKKEDYEPERKTKFETGNLAKAFLPQPEVVCFPLLSSVPRVEPPEMLHYHPAPPKIELFPLSQKVSEENLYEQNGPSMDPDSMGQYYQEDHEEPLLPPPQPPPYPQDDLSLLGISADDITAQMF